MNKIIEFKRLNSLKNRQTYGFILAGIALILGLLLNHLSFLFYFSIGYLAWKNHRNEVDEIGLYYYILPYTIIIGFSLWNYGVAQFVALIIAVLIAIMFSTLMNGLINKLDIKLGNVFLLPMAFFILNYIFDKLPAINILEVPSLLAVIHNHTPVLRMATIFGMYGTIFLIVLFINSIVGILVDKENIGIYKKVTISIIILMLLSNIILTSNLLVVGESRSITVAAVQGDVVSAEGRPRVMKEIFDFDFNYYKNMLENVDADIIVFPQVPLGIYDIENIVDHKYRERLINLAKEKEAIIVSLLIESSSVHGGKHHRFISSYLISPEGVIGKSSKRNLNFFTQRIIFSKSEDYSAISTDYGEFGIAIADDIRDLNTVRLLKKNGAQIILSTSNDDNFGVTFSSNYNIYPIMNAIKYNIPVVVANQDGTSMLVDRTGKVIDQLAVKEKGVLVDEIDIQHSISIYSIFGRHLELILMLVIVYLIAKGIKKYYF
ncbi:carbon-nitrogen hydrolase family protein [Alkaliphilus peptidifermentans]|uniref:Apolipoprotein N-acyltransferase n=1 Tax=Alkaliphilus peptidifermentans DSM 18978 TaxID=1120976 RepID=A0A1G5EJC1_9FIRM|nr:carbon-nitrogen hydrolase family protein [Alkaliphilus peptidifermentans]SCY27113.1 Apolipoprotein N-acyltransferase [Alkaliphilus peptidifermentans DSM 18978]